MPTRKAAPAWSAPTRIRRKTLLLDQRLLDRARHALGARTETQTVTQALEAVIRREHQVQGIRALATFGPIKLARID